MRAASVRRGPHQSGEGRIVTGSNCRWRYRNPGDQRNKHYQYRYFRMQQVGGTSRRKDMPCRTHRLRDRNRRACPLSGLPGRASCAGEYASEPERDAALPDGRSSQAPQRRCGGEPDSEGRAACTRHQRHPQASGKSCMGSEDVLSVYGCMPNGAWRCVDVCAAPWMHGIPVYINSNSRHVGAWGSFYMACINAPYDNGSLSVLAPAMGIGQAHG